MDLRKCETFTHARAPARLCETHIIINVKDVIHHGPPLTFDYPLPLILSLRANKTTTATGPIIRNCLLRIGFLIFRVFWIHPQAFSFRPSLADAN